MRAVVVEQLGRERSRPDPRRVRLDDADHLGDPGRRDARPDARAAGRRAGRGDERVRAVVHVEQGGLGALQQYRLAVLQRPAQHQPGVGDVRAQPLGVRQVLLDHGADVDRLAVVDLDEYLVLLPEHHLQLLAQDARIEQVLHSDADPGHLVPVRRADAPPGGTDPGRPQVPLDDPVQRPVMRHDQVRVGRDEQPLAGQAPLGETVDLGDQHLRVDHHAVADHRGAARRQYSRRQQVQRVLLAIRGDHGVPRVVAALVPDDVPDLPAEQVGNLAFAFVAPLGADQHDRWHLHHPGVPG